MKHWRYSLARIGWTALLALAVAAPAQATVMMPLDDSQLVQRAGQIVSGRVTDTVTERVGARNLRMTRVILAVDSRLKGTAGEQVDFWIPGGTSEGRTSMISGVQSFQKGQEVMVFLRENEVLGGREMVGLAQGRFDLLRDSEGRRQLAARDLSGISFYKPAALDPSKALDRNFANARLEGQALDQIDRSLVKISPGAEFYDFDKFVERVRSIVAEQADREIKP